MNRISERVNIVACFVLALLYLLPVCRGEGTNNNRTKLVDMATKKWGPLTNAEETLFQKVVIGKIADRSDSLEENNDPNDAGQWDKEKRSIRAECIYWLCTDREASTRVTHKGLLIKGVLIDGELNLKFAKIPFPLSFEKCVFPQGINLEEAEIRDLNLEGTHTGPIIADGLKVERNVFFHSGFKAEGEVRLVGATIGGNLECSDSQFMNKGAGAFCADGIKVTGGVFLYDGFKAEGEVRLIGASIGNDLSCGDAEFINPGGNALNGHGLSVGGFVFFRKPLRAEGAIGLLCVTIGRDLSCIGCNFINPNGYALNAGGLRVKGNVYFREGFEAEGKVSLECSTIDKYFFWTDVNCPDQVTLDLRSSKIGTLSDDEKSWPSKLLIHGFVYDTIDDKAPTKAEERIKWIQKQYDKEAEQDKKQFRPQPYEQLADVLRKSGREEDAKKILIAKNEDKARLSQLTRSERIWYLWLGPIIDYGYRPQKALWIMGTIIICGWIVFGISYYTGLITPDSDSAYTEKGGGIEIPGEKNRKLSNVYPRFSYVMYSIDVFVPLIDLHQVKYWLPNVNRGCFKIKGFSLICGIIRLYFWFHLTMGWILTTLLLVGLTGLIRT